MIDIYHISFEDKHQNNINFRGDTSQKFNNLNRPHSLFSFNSFGQILKQLIRTVNVKIKIPQRYGVSGRNFLRSGPQELNNRDEYSIKKNQQSKQSYLTDEFYQNKNAAKSGIVNIYKMDKEQQFPSLFYKIDNLPLHLLLTVLEYLDQEAKMRIQKNSPQNQGKNQIFLKLVSLSLFTEKYLRSTDRSMYLSFYSQPAFISYETNLLGDICVRDPVKYFKIQRSIENLFTLIDSQLQCLDSRQSLNELIENHIRDPQLPFPRMRKEGIAMYCSSSLQHALVDLFFDPQGEEEYVEDCVLDLEQFFQCLQGTLDEILQQRSKQRPKSKSIVSTIKQCYYHPQLLNLQNYEQYLIKSLTPYNLFVCIHALLSGIAEMYHEYILDQGKDFERFIQFLMRFSVYRSIILSFQTSKISKILYNAVERILEKAIELTEQRQTSLRIQEEVIMEASIRLQNKISEENEMEAEQISLVQHVSRISSQAKTQRSIEAYKNLNLKMTSRIFLAGCKIWTNQCRRVKQIYDQSNSPSRYLTTSQQTINNKNCIKILNRLLHFNLLQKLQKEIDTSCKLSTIKQVTPPPLRDEDIVNIFGNYQEYQAVSPTHSHHSNLSHHDSSSPNSPFPNFNEMLKSFMNISCDSTYSSILMAVENKIRCQPYRFQKNCELHYHNQTFSNSPDKQKCQIPQIHFESSNKIPSLRQKLLSKASMISKFTKMSDNKTIGSVQQLFESQVGIQQQILTEYHSYLIDLSVNQVNVHWIGHSDQYLMGDHYSHFEQYFMKFNEGFISYLVRIVEEAAAKVQHDNTKLRLEGNHLKIENAGSKVLKKLLQMQLQYLDTGFIGKRTIKKLVKAANQNIRNFIRKYEQNEQEFSPITLNIEEIDKMIQHYNQQMWRIDKNVGQEKLKVYEQRKSPRNIIQVVRCQHDENKQQKLQKKPERKRRNSDQVLVNVTHNLQ